MEEDINMKKVSQKLNALSNWKKIALIMCLLAILGALYYMTTIDVIQTFEYREHGIVVCSETYVNGKLNTTPCPQNTDYFPKEIYMINVTELQDLGFGN